MTAVEWLQKKLIESGVNLLSEEIEFIQQAKEMEKEQKELDYQSGYLDCYTKLNSEQLTRKI